MSSRSTRSGKKASLRTFTYYIPAPPSRKSGYREREFDKIMAGILHSGFELASLHTEAVSDGIFVVAVLKANSKKIADLDLLQDMQEKFKLTHAHSSPDIELEDEDV